MSIAHVSRDQGGGAGGATSAATAGAAHVAGNLLVALLQYQGTFSSISDTAGNTWTQAGTEFTAGSNKCRIYYAWNCLGNAANVVTVNFSGGTTYRDIVAHEFSGVQTSSDPIDGTAGNSGSSTSVSSGTVTIAGSDDVIVMFCEADGDSVSNATYNLTNHAVTGDAAKYFGDGYHLVAASEAATATCASGNWYCKAAAFKAAAGGGGGGSSPPELALLGCGA